MSAPPKTYRIYCYDVGQKSVSADFIKAAHDEDAIAQAEALRKEIAALPAMVDAASRKISAKKRSTARRL